VNRSEPLVGRSNASLLFAAAGVGLLVAQGLSPAYPDDTARQVAVAAAHRGAETGAVVAFLVAGALLSLAICGASGLVLRRGRALARVGVVLTAIGALWPVIGRAGFTATLVAVTGGDRASAVAAIHDPAATPSARVLDAMASDYENSYVRFVLAQSAAHRETVLALPFAADLAAHFAQLAAESLAEQRAIEAADTLPFDTFLERYLSPASLNV